MIETKKLSRTSLLSCLPLQTLVCDWLFTQGAAIVLLKPFFTAVGVKLVRRMAWKFYYVNSLLELFHTDGALDLALFFISLEFSCCESLHHVGSETCPLGSIRSSDVVAQTRQAYGYATSNE